MILETHPHLYRLLRFLFRLFKPRIGRLAQLYTSYKNTLPDWQYNSWALTYKNYCYVEKQIHYKPLISVVMPAYNPSQTHLLQAVYSIVNQHYENWELIIINASTHAAVRRRTRGLGDIDTRIRVVNIPKNLGISANTNLAIKHAAGEFITLFDHDDLMHPCALHSVIESMQGLKKPDLIYTDEDKVSNDAALYFNPHCKPGWSPDLLRNVNYITHLTTIRKSMIDKVGGLKASCDGAQDYDLVLRVIDKCHPKIIHVPRILYSWRSSPSSTAGSVDAKPYITKAGVKALRDHIKRNNIPAKATIIEGKPGFYRLIYTPVDFSIVIGRVSLAKQQATAKWLQKMLETADLGGGSIELIIGDWYKKFKQPISGLRICYVPERDRNYWKQAVSMVTKPVAICFKMAATPKDKHALAQLAAAAMDVNHTAVSPIILGGESTILDSGLVHSPNLPIKLFEGYKLGKYTYFGNTDWVRDVDDLTTNIVAITTDKLRELMQYGVQGYHHADTILSILPGTPIKGSNFVVWAHSVFEYRSLLKPVTESTYHNSQLFRFTPTVTMHVDNWGEEYVREPED